jgi:hypothetical protein
MKFHDGCGNEAGSIAGAGNLKSYLIFLDIRYLE